MMNWKKYTAAWTAQKQLILKHKVKHLKNRKWTFQVPSACEAQAPSANLQSWNTPIVKQRWARFDQDRYSSMPNNFSILFNIFPVDVFCLVSPKWTSVSHEQKRTITKKQNTTWWNECILVTHIDNPIS